MAHLTAQPVQSLAVDLHAVVALQHRHQPSTAEARVDQVDLVQQPLDADVLRIFGGRFVIGGGTRHA